MRYVDNWVMLEKKTIIKCAFTSGYQKQRDHLEKYDQNREEVLGSFPNKYTFLATSEISILYVAYHSLDYVPIIT